MGVPQIKTLSEFSKITFEFHEGEFDCPVHGTVHSRYWLRSDGTKQWDECPMCAQKRQEVEERKREEANKVKRYEGYSKSRVKPKFYDMDFSSYKTSNESQEKALQLITEIATGASNKSLLLLGGNGVGKEEWVEQIIPTPKGFRRFGDLKVGDYVYDSNGKSTKVLGVFPQGVKDSYKITFSDGRSDICGLEHLWGVYSRSHDKWKYQILSLEQILEKGIRKNKGARFYIDASPVIECPEKELPLDPYIVGSFLGNGCCLETNLTLSSNDEWQVRKCANILGYNIKKYSCKNYSWYFEKGGRLIKTKDILPNELRCYAHDKCIPKDYMFASVKQRQALLQGLFDTDGSATVAGTRLYISYSTVSKQLAEDVRTLLLSFGIVSYIGEDKRKNRICYYLSVNCSVEKAKLLFSLPRKLDKVNCPTVRKGSHRDYSKVAICSVEKLGKKEMQCIYVDNERHLYLTKDFLVTHNTMLASIAVMFRGGAIYKMYEIIVRIKASYKNNSAESEMDILNELSKLPLLVIDEVGRSFGSESEKNWLSYIIDERYEDNLPTILISNLKLSRECSKAEQEQGVYLEHYLGKDSVSRLAECADIVTIAGEDWRRKNRT